MGDPEAPEIGLLVIRLTLNPCDLFYEKKSNYSVDNNGYKTY